MNCIDIHKFKKIFNGAISEYGDKIKFDKNNKNAIIGITLMNDSDRERELAICLIVELKWDKLFCIGDDEFLLQIGNRILAHHKTELSSVKRVTFIFSENCTGFSESDDWSPTPQPRQKPEPKSHGNKHDLLELDM